MEPLVKVLVTQDMGVTEVLGDSSATLRIRLLCWGEWLYLCLAKEFCILCVSANK